MRFAIHRAAVHPRHPRPGENCPRTQSSTYNAEPLGGCDAAQPGRVCRVQTNTGRRQGDVGMPVLGVHMLPEHQKRDAIAVTKIVVVPHHSLGKLAHGSGISNNQRA